MDDGQGFESAFFNGSGYTVRIDRFVPFKGEFLYVFTVRNGHLVPTIRKSAVDAGKHFLLHKIADGGFLQSGAGGGAQENAILCIEKLPRFFGCAAKDGFELLAAVRQHGLRLRTQDFVIYVHRAVDEHAGHDLPQEKGKDDQHKDEKASQ